MKARNIHTYLLIGAIALLPGVTVAQAQSTQTAAKHSASAEGDITTVTVFGKLKPPTDSLTIDRSSASSCGFMSSSGSGSDGYVRRVIRDESDDYRFSTRSPYGDASREYNVFYLRDRVRDGGGRSIGGGCGPADFGFAAGRAHIEARDTTMREAVDLYNAGKYPESLAMFKKAYSKIGYHEAALMIAKMHLYGVGTEKDVPEAIKWFEKLANRPNRSGYKSTSGDMTPMVEASMMLAKIYLIGFDVQKDPKAARKWFDRAYDVGYAPAGKTLGDMYYFGYDTPRDLGKAVKHYTDTASHGYAPAQYALANILYSGEETIKADPKKALDWYWHAAKQKHPGATYAVARAYDLGENVKAAPDRALSLYKEAAIGGDGDAQNALGTYFYNGQILPKDQPTARKWFEAAAVRGQVDGMFNLGVMMMKGEGGVIDHTKAYAWLTLAQTAGHPNAEAVLKILEGRMTPAEKAAAEALLVPQA
jgi:TPR repeat protein